MALKGYRKKTQKNKKKSYSKISLKGYRNKVQKFKNKDSHYDDDDKKLVRDEGKKNALLFYEVCKLIQFSNYNIPLSVPEEDNIIFNGDMDIIDDNKRNGILIPTSQIIEECKWLIDKLDKLIVRTGIGNINQIIDDVVSSGSENLVLARSLCKDPLKGSIFQKRFYSRMDEVLNGRTDIIFTKNPTPWIYLNPDGNISKIKAGREKNMDAILEIRKSKERSLKVYISHKKIGNPEETGGGNQDNEFSEIMNFVSYANINNKSDTYFLLAYDGNHFTDDRVESLLDMANTEKVFIKRAKCRETLKDLIDFFVSKE